MNETIKITQDHIEKAVRTLQKNGSEWQIDHCDCCPKLILYAASRTCPGDLDCEAGLDPLDFHCHRKNTLWDDPRVIAEAERQACIDAEWANAPPSSVDILLSIENALRIGPEPRAINFVEVVSFGFGGIGGDMGGDAV